MPDLVLKQVRGVIDRRTTVICLHVNGQIRPVEDPFDTLSGSFDRPPFHAHCRSMVVPWMSGFADDARAEANAELLKRPASQRRIADGRLPNRIPGPKTTTQVPEVVQPVVPQPWQTTSAERTTAARRARAATKPEAEKFLADAFDAVDQPVDVRASVDSYQGVEAFRLNEYLRKPQGRSDYFVPMRDGIDKAIAGSTTTKPMVAYRGLSEDLFSALDVGDTFTDDGFVSTTVFDWTARDFANQGPFKTGQVVQIEIPEGASALLVNALTGQVPGLAGEEGEVLLPRGSKFVVASKGEMMILRLVL